MYFHAYFRNTVKTIPRISCFNLTVGLWKMHRFLPLNFILIPIMQINRTKFWSRINYFWKVPILHIIQNHWKNLAIFWALQFQFNCWTYQIRQLSFLKLPMDSQCIQATSSKNISVPNVRTDFPIYIAMQSGTLTKMSKWCFVWQWHFNKNVKMMFCVAV